MKDESQFDVESLLGFLKCLWNFLQRIVDKAYNTFALIRKTQRSGIPLESCIVLYGAIISVHERPHVSQKTTMKKNSYNHHLIKSDSGNKTR